MWPSWGVTQTAGELFGPGNRGGCLISTDVSSTPPHPLSPQLGTCVLQGGEVLGFPFCSPPSLTHAGDKRLPLAGPLLSFWADRCGRPSASGRGLRAKVSAGA